jgi:sigma-E factor negative regulatory protein RseC
MQQQVKVLSCSPDGTARVMLLRQSACSGDCHKCSGCGAAKETMLLKAENLIGACKGDLVVIQSQTGPVMKAVGVFYVLPMILFFVGYWLGDLWWNSGALIGGLAFVAGIAGSVVYDRKVARKEKNVYKITGFAGDHLLESLKKGDNSLD